MNKIVEKILYEDEDARNNDKWLLLRVWHEQGFYLTEMQQARFLRSCTTPETITRLRRKMRYLYPGTSKTEKQRRVKEEHYRQGNFI